MALWGSKKGAQQAQEHVDHMNSVCSNSSCWCHDKAQVTRRVKDIEKQAEQDDKNEQSR